MRRRRTAGNVTAAAALMKASKEKLPLPATLIPLEHQLKKDSHRGVIYKLTQPYLKDSEGSVPSVYSRTKLLYKEVNESITYVEMLITAVTTYA